MKKQKFIEPEQYVVLDTETTGFRHDDQVIEIGCQRIVNGEVKDSFHEFLIPTVPVSQGSFEIHKLDERFLCENGTPARHVFPKFVEFLNNDPIAGHNISFDKRMIEQHAKHCGITIDLSIAFCTLKLAKQAFKNEKSHKLENLAEKLGLCKGLGLVTHRAMADVKITIKLLQKIVEEFGTDLPFLFYSGKQMYIRMWEDKEQTRVKDTLLPKSLSNAINKSKPKRIREI